MKLYALEISNFKGIAEKIRILIDSIVVLIGPNNCCKSTVLDAYEAYYSLGSSLTIDSFHHGESIKPIEIVGVFTDISDEDIDSLGREWLIENDTQFGKCAKFMVKWEEPDKDGEKYSWSNKTNTWIKGGAGGWNSILSSRLPKPIRINPFDTTEKLESVVKDIISKLVADSIKKDKGKLKDIAEKIKELGKEMEQYIEKDLDEINDSLRNNMRSAFYDLDVFFDTNVGKFEPEKAIKEGSRFIFTTNNMQASLDNQGSGVQRAFLWSAIKAYSDKGILKRGKATIGVSDSKILLIDEPEINLHPAVIRAAREGLYALAKISGWQIICTTHSPAFIDLSNDHTTIIKVSNTQSDIKYFQTDTAAFSEDEKINLKMINICNPLVNEFFFYETAVLVEGETEETALKILLDHEQCGYKFCVLNCRGKGNIPTFIKILNKFMSHGIVLHDADEMKLDDGRINAMWTINSKILEECQKANFMVYPIVHYKDFESYYFSEKVSTDKPYHVYLHLMEPDFYTNPKYKRLTELASHLNNGNHPCKYTSENEFKLLVN